MTYRLAVLCIVSALFAAPGFSQDRGTPDPQTMAERRVNMLVRLLNLTDAQKASATTIYVDAYSASQNLQTSLRSNRESVSEAVKKNDTAAIDSLALTLGTLTGQIAAIEGKAEAAFYLLLTADQKTKYDSVPRGGPMGPGGRGPAGFRGRGSQGQ